MKIEIVEWIEKDPSLKSPPENFHTLADIKIETKDSVITKHRDTSDNKILDTLCVEIYPMAEELSFWLLYDKEDLDSILGYGEGNIYPYIKVKIDGDNLLLKWKSERRHNSFVEFLEFGKLNISIEEFDKIALEFCKKVFKRLLEKNIRATELERNLFEMGALN